MSSAAATPTVWTAEMLERLPKAGRGVEIVRGEWFEAPPADLLRSHVIAEPIQQLGERSGHHWVFCGAGFKLEGAPDTILAPAVSLVRRSRLPKVSGLDYPSLARDLVVEVVGRSDPASEFFSKLGILLGAGVSTVWVVDPCFQQAEIHRPGQPVVRLGLDDALEDPTLLPGLSIPLTDLFPRE